jgi:hypothetical protein
MMGFCFFVTASRPALGTTRPPIQWVPGALTLGVKQPERETDQSPPSNAEVKMRGAIPLLPQYICMVQCLSKWYVFMSVVFTYDTGETLPFCDMHIWTGKKFAQEDL